jgi:hypothetical protein
MQKIIVTQLYYNFTLFTHFNIACLFNFKTVIPDKSAILTYVNTETI